MKKVELTTTFKLLNQAGACSSRYKRLAKALGGIRKYGKDTPINMLTILDTNGVDDMLWALRAVPLAQKAKRDRVSRLIACDFAENVLHLYEKEYPADARPRNCIDTARRSAIGEATKEELDAARAAAEAATEAAAIDAARDATRVATTVAASAAARDAAWATARDIAMGFAGNATSVAEIKIREKIIRKYLK